MKEFNNGLENKWEFEENPFDSEVKIKDLKKFLKPEDTLIFYGGEPLIMLDKIKEIIDNINCRFCMQTNGKLLDQLPKKYLLKLDKILVSIDGTLERTDENKGKGTYDLVLKNVKEARKKGFKGEIVARMVINNSDIFTQVKHLTDLIGLGIFDSVHFQIDAGFYKNDYNKEEFSKFTREYNKSLSELINYWVNEMKKGNVLKIYPFLGIFESIYYNKESKLRCGSGYANFTITTNGELSACPIMNSVKTFYCGSIKEGIKKEIECIEPCISCRYYKICGGRCLYSNYAKLWPRDGEKLICSTIIHLIKEIERVLPEIKNLISKGIVKEEDFSYEKYFGPEIIP
jgi:putative peptide-modifying radical SAM enzyme